MTSLHLMSREELARELVDAQKNRRNTARTDATPTPNCLGTPAYDQKVRRKLDLAREILLRDLAEPLKRTWSLTSPKIVREWLTIRYCGVEREIFLALYLDVKMRLIDTEDLSVGTLTTTSAIRANWSNQHSATMPASFSLHTIIRRAAPIPVKPICT